jgi:hypothetical protein
MKKLLLSLTVLLGVTGFAGVVWALPYYQNTQGLVPGVTNEYYIGTSTPSLKEYKGIYVRDLTISGTCTGCGAGGSSFPFTVTDYGVATSTTIGFLNGLLTTASSTLNASTTITGVLTASGGIYGSLTGLASLATALAANGTNCSAGNAPLGVDASGNSEGCFSVSTFGYPFPSNATSTLLTFTGGMLVNNATSTITNLVAVNSTSTNATTTSFSISGVLDIDQMTSALLLTGATGIVAEYAGTSCTNQFVRSLSALGVATCATVGSADVSLADLTATNSTLTFSGTYNGSTARTIGINLGNANTWSVLQTFTGGILVNNATSTITNLTTTNSTSTSATTTNLYSSGTTRIASITGLLLGTSGTVSAYGGSNPCINQVAFSISASGVITCTSITNAQWSGTDLAVTNGGTSLSTFGGTNTILYTTTADTLVSLSTFVFDQGRQAHGIGTSTPRWSLQAASSTGPQLALSDASLTSPHVTFRNASGNLYIGTSSPSTFATSTNIASSLVIMANGQVSTAERDIATSTTMTIDWHSTPNQVLVRVLGSAMTIGFNNASTSGMTKRVMVCNGATTASTVTWVGVLWPSETAPTHITTASHCAMYSFVVSQATSTSLTTTKVFGAQTSF